MRDCSLLPWRWSKLSAGRHSPTLLFQTSWDPKWFPVLCSPHRPLRVWAIRSLKLGCECAQWAMGFWLACFTGSGVSTVTMASWPSSNLILHGQRARKKCFSLYLCHSQERLQSYSGCALPGELELVRHRWCVWCSAACGFLSFPIASHSLPVTCRHGKSPGAGCLWIFNMCHASRWTRPATVPLQSS